MTCAVNNACEPEGLSYCFDGSGIACYAVSDLVNACFESEVAAIVPGAAFTDNGDLFCAVPNIANLVAKLDFSGFGNVEEEGVVFLGIVSRHLEIVAEIPAGNSTADVHIVSLCKRFSLFYEFVGDLVISGVIGVSGVDDLVNTVLALCEEYVPSPVFFVEFVVTFEDYNAVRINNGCELLVSSGVGVVIISVSTISICNAGNVTDTNLTVVSTAVADLECITCVHENFDLVYVSGSVFGLGHYEVFHGVSMVPTTLLHIAGAGTDEVVFLIVSYEYVAGVLSEDVGIFVNNSFEVKLLGQGCFCIPAGEIFAFNCGSSPRSNLGAFFNLLFVEKLAALVPANGYLVSIVSRGSGLFGLTKQVARCEASDRKRESHDECDDR